MGARPAGPCLAGLLAAALLLAACAEAANTPTTAPQASTTTTPADASTPTATTSTTTTLPTTTSSTLPPFPGREALAAARALWESQGPTRYRYRASRGSAWGASGPYDVYVDGDLVVEVPQGQAVGVFLDVRNRNPYDHLFGTIENLFAIIESVPDASLTVEYDPGLGFPTRIGFDAPGCIDEEWGLSLETLEPYDGPIPDPEPLPPPDPEELDLVRSLYYVNALVVATVTGPVGIGEAFCARAWTIAVEVERGVHTGTVPGSPPIEAGTSLVVRDGSHPRLLHGLEGARVLLPLFLASELSPDYYLPEWVAALSDQGFDFVGDRGDLFDAELPFLCRASVPGSTLDPSQALPLLLAWADAMAGWALAPGDARDEATAAALAEVCTDLFDGGG